MLLRSEEHTLELQSHPDNSHVVCYLQKNKLKINQVYMMRGRMAMNRVLLISLSLLSVVCFFACSNKDRGRETNPVMSQAEQAMIINSQVMTKADQARLTPAMVLDTLKKGNAEFVNDALTIRNNPERVRDAAAGQYPKAVLLSCLDSRVPVEDVFHRGIEIGRAHV